MRSPTTKAALRYWPITRSGQTVTDADRKCFVATAAAPAPQNSGTRCVFGVPPALQNVSSGAARYAEFRTYEISLLLRSRAGFAKCWRLHSHPLDVAMQDSRRRKMTSFAVSAPKTECFLLSSQLAQNPTASQSFVAQRSRPHSKLRARSPLSVGFSEPFDPFAGF